MDNHDKSPDELSVSLSHDQSILLSQESWSWSCKATGSNLVYTFYSCTGHRKKDQRNVEDLSRTFNLGNLGGSYGICEEFIKGIK